MWKSWKSSVRYRRTTSTDGSWSGAEFQKQDRPARYLEPIVHEIKVSRADLLGDLKRLDKRNAYLDVGGQRWYVLGSDAKGRSIGEADEIPLECGVMICLDNKLEVARMAPKRPSQQLPFGVWMALAKATPVSMPTDFTDHL
jgi:hypothetical protein